MAELDTSTYPRAAPVQQQNPLDTVGKLQEMQQRSIGIDQSKLKLVNDKWDFSSKALGALLNKPGLNGKDLQDTYQFLHKRGIMDDDQFAKEVSSIKTIEGVKRQYPNASPEQQQQILSQLHQNDVKGHLLAGASKMEQLNGAYGSNAGMFEGGNYKQPYNVFNGQIRSTGQPIPTQLGPETSTFHPATETEPPHMAPAGAPSFPVIPPGQFPGQNNGSQRRLPTQDNPPGLLSNPRPVPTVQPPPMAKPDYSPVNPTGNLTGPPTSRPGSPPMGLPESIESGQKQYAAATEQAGRTLQGLKPAQQAVKLMDAEVIKGLTGTGPIAAKTSAVLSALQGIGFTTRGTDAVAQRQELVKKLAQYLRNSPSGQRSDAAQDLAAKANADPNVQNLKALIDITRDNIAYDRVDAAKALSFQRGEKNKRYNEFAEHQGNFPNTIDARAFKLDTMSDKERNEFLDHIEKTESPAQRKKFKESYNLAKQLGMM